MSIVNRFPQGLLGLLQSKTTGQTPSEAEQKLQLSLDLLPFYLSGISLRAANQPEATNTTGVKALVSVPPAETWAVVAVSANALSLNAGDICNLQPVIENVPPSETASTPFPFPIPIGSSDTFQWSALVAGDNNAITHVFSTPLIVRSPVQFGSLVNKIAPTTNVNVETRVLFYQLD